MLLELAADKTFRRGRSDLRTSRVHVSYLRRSARGPVQVEARRVHQGRLFGEVALEGRDAEGRVCVIGGVSGRAV